MTGSLAYRWVLCLCLGELRRRRDERLSYFWTTKPSACMSGIMPSVCYRLGVQPALRTADGLSYSTQPCVSDIYPDIYRGKGRVLPLATRILAILMLYEMSSAHQSGNPFGTCVVRAPSGDCTSYHQLRPFALMSSDMLRSSLCA